MPLDTFQNTPLHFLSLGRSFPLTTLLSPVVFAFGVAEPAPAAPAAVAPSATAPALPADNAIDPEFLKSLKVSILIDVYQAICVKYVIAASVLI